MRNFRIIFIVLLAMFTILSGCGKQSSEEKTEGEQHTKKAKAVATEQATEKEVKASFEVKQDLTNFAGEGFTNTDLEDVIKNISVTGDDGIFVTWITSKNNGYQNEIYTSIGTGGKWVVKDKKIAELVQQSDDPSRNVLGFESHGNHVAYVTGDSSLHLITINKNGSSADEIIKKQIGNLYGFAKTTKGDAVIFTEQSDDNIHFYLLDGSKEDVTFNDKYDIYAPTNPVFIDFSNSRLYIGGGDPNKGDVTLVKQVDLKTGEPVYENGEDKVVDLDGIIMDKDLENRLVVAKLDGNELTISRYDQDLNLLDKSAPIGVRDVRLDEKATQTVTNLDDLTDYFALGLDSKKEHMLVFYGLTAYERKHILEYEVVSYY
ncbi:hypothetical protein [Neobacillus cucumis]|uniref:Lipoprotein n=1 Tax=Neobacillus cucumis TaxID=1740721 RepID=A0A2N5HCY1_9BACI|nr:hypothetical protein [Neobacillus cucumis]PLS03379.1 hypothetical protein CVD27_15005 [Neobacillus cucumis]